MSCESMVVRLVLYEKAEMSNVTYIKTDKEHSVFKSNEQIPLPRNVLYPAYSQDKQKMNYVRLPICEDDDTKERIAILRLDLDDALKITTNTYDDGSKDRSSRSASFKEKLKRGKRNSDKRASNEDEKRNSQPIESVTDTVWFHSETVSRPGKRQARCNNERTEEIESFRSKNNRANSLLGLNDDTDTLTYTKLNLSRREMYITGLYVPHTENKVLAEVKLHRAKMCKGKMHADNETKGSGRHTLSGSHDQPIRVPMLKENIHSRIRPRSLDARISKKGQIENDSGSEKLWGPYIKKQETLEMEMALNNNLAVNIIDRLQNSKLSSSVDRTLSKTRDKKAKKQHKKGLELGDSNDRTSKSQRSSRRSTNRSREDSKLSQGVAPEMQLDELRMPFAQSQLGMNFNSNAIVHLPRKRIVSKSYLYVHEFQEPIVRTPRPPSEYEKRRSFQILNHTPYEIVSIENSDASCSGSESNYNNVGPRRRSVSFKMNNCNFPKFGLHRFACRDGASLGESEFCKCSCAECQCLREGLADLKPDTKCLPPDYRQRLGKLRRDFDFFKSENDVAPIQDKQIEVTSHFVTIDVPQIRDQLMRLVDNVIFRKEILISNLGQTHTTVTFIKGRASKN